MTLLRNTPGPADRPLHPLFAAHLPEAAQDTTTPAAAASPGPPLPVAHAQALLHDLMTPIADTQTLPLMQALGRIVSADIVAPIDVPSHDNSAMDGYAFDGRLLDMPGRVAPDGTLTLMVCGHALAGHPLRQAVPPGQCARVMTGAVIPAGADTVIPFEYARVEKSPTHDTDLDPAASADGADGAHAAAPSGQAVQQQQQLVTLTTKGFARGANQRHAGEDLARGQTVLHAGRRLRAADLGVLASLGIAQVAVRRKLRVAYFSTGDELRPVGEPLEPGCVHDSNRYTLHGMLQRLGVETIDLGIVRDDPAALSLALRDAASQADAVISSGGVSAGDADFVRDVFAALGDVVFWKLAMRPGRPFAFGRLIADNALDGGARVVPFFGLPGNPVAVMAAFYHIVRGALLQLAGALPEPVPRVSARALATIRKRRDRTEFARGLAHRQADGSWQVGLAGAQGSGVLSSMSEANCFIILEHAQGDVAPGDLLDIMFFEGLI